MPQKKHVWKPWTTEQLRFLHFASANHFPMAKVCRKLGRTVGAIRQKARSQGLSTGVIQRSVSTRNKRYAARRKLGIGANNLHF